MVTTTETTTELAEREYAQLVERHRDELHAHSRRILRSSHDAEDAVQEALLRAWRALPSLEARDSARGWLHRIVANTSLDEVRRRRQRVVPIDLDRDEPDGRALPGVPEPGADARYASREECERALHVAMRVLPPRQRAVLILREALGFSARDTASLLGISVAASNSLLQRARERLTRDDHEPAIDGPGPTDERRLRERAASYADAWERDDLGALVAMLASDAGAGQRASAE